MDKVFRHRMRWSTPRRTSAFFHWYPQWNAVCNDFSHGLIGHFEVRGGGRGRQPLSPSWWRGGGADRSSDTIGPGQDPVVMTTGASSPRLTVSGWSRRGWTPRRAGCPEPDSPPGTLFRRGGTVGTASQPQVRQREPADCHEDGHWTPVGRTGAQPGRRQRPAASGGRMPDCRPRPVPLPAASESAPTAYSTSSGSPASSSLSVMNDGIFSTAFWSSSTPTTA